MTALADVEDELASVHAANVSMRVVDLLYNTEGTRGKRMTAFFCTWSFTAKLSGSLGGWIPRCFGAAST